MKPEKIPVWLARDKGEDEDEGTWLYFIEPVWDKEAQRYYPAEGQGFVDFAEMPEHYGLEPGQCKLAYLVIEEEKQP